MINNFSDFYKKSFHVDEKVQQDFLNNNRDFYLNKNRSSYKEKNINIKKELSKLDPFDIKCIEQNRVYKFPQIDKITGTENIGIVKHKYDDNMIFSICGSNEYGCYWKMILSLMNFLKIDEFYFKSLDIRNEINDLFKYINDYYGLYYKVNYCEYYTFLTKNKENYIKEIKNHRKNIIYYNNNMRRGREFFDIKGIELSNIIDKFKKINVDDIKILDQNGYHIIRFKNDELDKIYMDLNRYPIAFHRANSVQEETSLFGKNIGNRFHMNSQLCGKLRNIGLGYKMYKAFIKKIGYVTSNIQASSDAKNIYSKLIQDDDFYVIVEINKDLKNYYGSQKVLIIDKQYPKLNDLLALVKDYEKEKGIKLIYDKELQDYMKKMMT